MTSPSKTDEACSDVADQHAELSPDDRVAFGLPRKYIGAGRVLAAALWRGRFR
jgi:hypothetical protein